MIELEIIKMWNYYERIIFLTKIGNKYHLFYKSSGLAGYGTKGEVFPCMRLKDNEICSPDGLGGTMLFGWIPKYYFYRGHFTEYFSKHRSEFPKNMYRFLDYLEEVDTKGVEVMNDPRAINKYCEEFIKDKDDYYDWSIT